MVKGIIFIGVAIIIGTTIGTQMVERTAPTEELVAFKRGFPIAGYVVRQDDISGTLVVRVGSYFPGEATSTRDFAVVYDASTNWLDTTYLFSDGIIEKRKFGTSTKMILPPGALVYVTVVHPADSTLLRAHNIIIQRRENL